MKCQRRMKLVVVVIMRTVVLRLMVGIVQWSTPAEIHRKDKEKHTKTDMIDAQFIAWEFKDGRLECIMVSDKKREKLRGLFRRRNDLVKGFRRIKSYLKMQLLCFGIMEPEELDNDHWIYIFFTSNLQH